MSNNQSIDKHSKVKKKKIFAILLFTIAAFFLVGTIAAYYSDIFSGAKEIKTSELKIGGSYTFFLNGDEVQADNINGLNPGDVIVVRANIVNNGNQSAWIRERIDFSGADAELIQYLLVYEGEYTQSDFASAENYDEFLLDSNNGIIVGTNKVINGSGDNGEIAEGEFDLLGASSYSFVLTIRFLPSAGNLTQGLSFNFAVTTQALQFRNNNTVEPNEEAWESVQAA